MSKYAILTDLDEENVASDIEGLKRKIQDVSSKSTKGGHEKAKIKLERGLKTQLGPKQSSDPGGTGIQRGKKPDKQKGPIKRGPTGQVDKQPRALQVMDGNSNLFPSLGQSLVINPPTNSNQSRPSVSDKSNGPPPQMDVYHQTTCIMTTEPQQEAMEDDTVKRNTEMEVKPSSKSLKSLYL